MQIKIFNIPIGAEENHLDEMNHFLRANKIIDIRKELAIVGGNSCRSFCITYMLSCRVSDSEHAKIEGSKKWIIKKYSNQKFSKDSLLYVIISVKQYHLYRSNEYRQIRSTLMLSDRLQTAPI